MLKVRKNQVATALKTACDKYELAFSDFIRRIYEDINEYYLLAEKRNEANHFEVVKSFDLEGGYKVTYRPGRDEIQVSVKYPSFESALSLIDDWIAALAYEKKIPDLWEEFAKLENTDLLEASDNEPFTQDEKIKAAQALNDVKVYILENGNYDAELTAHIDEKIAYLESKLSSVGKKDFTLLFMGALLGLVLNHVFSPDNVGDILNFAMEQIRIQLMPDVPMLPN